MSVMLFPSGLIRFPWRQSCFYTSPFIVVVFAHFVFREKMTVKKTTALLICFIGCIFTVGLGVFVESALTPAGLLAGLGSALGYALYNLFTKVLVRKYHTFTVTFYTFVCVCRNHISGVSIGTAW